MIGVSGNHRRSDPQQPVNLPEVPMYEMQRDRVPEVFQLLAEIVGQIGKPTHRDATGDVVGDGTPGSYVAESAFSP